MPVLSVTELNIVVSVLGAFMILYGLISVKIKSQWYLGEALPAVAVGVILGPIAAKFLDSTRWGNAIEGQKEDIVLGTMRIMIGVQLVIAGYQLPAKWLWTRWKEVFICLVPVMTVMWIATSACVIATIPKLSLLATLVIGACVTPTDPILSQAIAKGPFADKYVRRDLREMISGEAGANDGFAFPFLMMAVALMRHSEVPEGSHSSGAEASVNATAAMGAGAVGGQVSTINMALTSLMGRATEGADSGDHGGVGRLGGGVGVAITYWLVETLLYTAFMAMAYGFLAGYLARIAIKFALRRKWVDTESYLLYPTAIGLFIIGTGGAIGTSDLLACFFAGLALNWDGNFLAETLQRHDEVNSCIDVILNFGGFMLVGIVLPWDQWQQPDTTGITVPRLIGLGFMVMLFRRIPAIMMAYKGMPNVVANWKEAVFMGYFGPIGVGAVFYVEHTRHLFPELDKADEGERALLNALGPVVYFLVLFSIIFHGLSIPLLDFLYRWYGVKPIQEDATEVKRRSMWAATPENAVNGDSDTIIAFNRFSRPMFNAAQQLPRVTDDGRYIEPGDYDEIQRAKQQAQMEYQRQPKGTMQTSWV